MESLVRDLSKGRFWKSFGTHGFSALGALAVVAGFVDLFTTGYLAQNSWIFWPLLAVGGIYGLIRAWPRPVETSYESPRTTIRLVRGDLFADTDAHLVIGASDTFDTVAPHISPNSVQGQFLLRIYGGDSAKLDADITDALPSSVETETITGKVGKTTRYPLGTVVTLRSNAQRYFLVAYTRMNARSSVSSTSDGMWNSLSSLWKEVRAESNGGLVRIPLIGGGQSKLSSVLHAQDSVRFTALSFILASRKEKVCDELEIVAQPGQYEKLDHLELQAFFDSLRPS